MDNVFVSREVDATYEAFKGIFAVYTWARLARGAIATCATRNIRTISTTRRANHETNIPIQNFLHHHAIKHCVRDMRADQLRQQHAGGSNLHGLEQY